MDTDAWTRTEGQGHNTTIHKFLNTYEMDMNTKNYHPNTGPTWISSK